MKTGTVEDLIKFIKLLKSLDEDPECKTLKKWQRAAKPEVVSRYDMNLIVHRLAVATSNFGGKIGGNIEALNEAYQKELPTLRKIFSDKVLMETIVPVREKLKEIREDVKTSKKKRKTK